MPYFSEHELAADHLSARLSAHHANTSGTQMVGAIFVFPESGDCQSELAILSSLPSSLPFGLHIHKVLFMDLDFHFTLPDQDSAADDVTFVTSYSALMIELQQYLPQFLEETRELEQSPMIVVLGVNQTLKPFFVRDKQAIIDFMVLCRDMRHEGIIPNDWTNFLTRFPGIYFQSWMRQSVLSEDSLVVESKWEDLIEFHQRRLASIDTQNLIADIPLSKCSSGCGINDMD